LFAYDSGASILPSAKGDHCYDHWTIHAWRIRPGNAGTRKTLERLPDQKWNWKPHDKSGTVGWLAATSPPCRVDHDDHANGKIDYAPVGAPPYEPPKLENHQQVLAESTRVWRCAQGDRRRKRRGDDEGLTLLAGGQTIFTMRVRLASAP